MRAFLVTLLIFSTIGALLLLLGAAIGFLLHWLIPSVDLGIGMLIGVITIGFTSQLFARISSMPLDDPLNDPTFAEPFTPQRITYLIDPPTPPRRRKRKQTGAQ
jgi:hypothetical protein